MYYQSVKRPLQDSLEIILATWGEGERRRKAAQYCAAKQLVLSYNPARHRALMDAALGHA